MPIIVKDDKTVVNANNKGVSRKMKKAYSPSFFNKNVLTGKGGTSRGLLNETVDPKNHAKGYHNTVNADMTAGKIVNGNTTIYNIPFYIIDPTAWNTYISEFERPDDMVRIATLNQEEIYLWMPIHAVQVEETKIQTNNGQIKSGNALISRDLSACFHMFLFSIKDPSNKIHQQARLITDLSNSGNTFHQDIVHTMYSALRNVEAALTSMGYNVDRDAMNTFYQDYSIYIEICKAAERWIEKTDYYIADVFARNASIYCNRSGATNDPWTGFYSVAKALSRIEKYNVPLDLYHDMYQKLKSYATPSNLTAICKANLNLMLSDTLHHMDANRANLHYCPDTNKSMLVNCPSDNPLVPGLPYSQEQKNAVASTSPLTLVQSGAGTGKSTIILGRIQHMIANGIDPNKILVLSFTNNAADHILEKNPKVNSMTIDRMMRTIYNENYPNQQLSNIPTIINSIDIYYYNSNTKLTPQFDIFLTKFKRILDRLYYNLEYTAAMNFIEENIDDVINVLEKIEQTSLELQSIICYLKMDTLKEPPEVNCEHLIIDEVQDNSISQFIYSIKYTDKHMCSLYMVGDCSQTLYEFRASNPKALNVLENSGVFSTYKLQTNYRSNQEILDFANIGLSNIEANQYANIQLHANSLRPVTYKSFTDAVKLHYEQMKNKSANSWEALWAKSVNVTKEYIQDKLDKGEQVTILARRRSDIYNVTKYIEKAFPTAPVIDKTTGKQKVDSNGNPMTKTVSIATLIPQRQYNNTILSDFIKYAWNNIKYAPPTSILQTITRSIMAQIPNITHKQSNLTTVQTSAIRVMDEFKKKFGYQISNLEKKVQASKITQKQMLDQIKKYMLSFEIERNSINQAIMSTRNNDTKNSDNIANANFITSTIHSAKGLEFDNVIVYYDGSSESKMDEATKRMYYVALTRAKKTEFIFAYDTLVKPKVGSDYDKIKDGLLANEKKQAANAITTIDASTSDITTNSEETANDTLMTDVSVIDSATDSEETKADNATA